MRIPLITICIAAISLSSVPTLQAQDTIRKELKKRQVEVRQKLDDLFAHRDNPIPQLDNALNPFYREDTAETLPEPEDGEPRLIVPPTRKDSQLLAEIAQSMVISGTVSYNNRMLIVINQTPTPAGRRIAVEFEGIKRFVLVEEIHSNRVVLSLGSAIMAMPITAEEKPEGGVTEEE
jgi:hypothetical protein